MSDVLIKVENVSKKFCRDLKRSLWYGMQDLGNELLGRRHGGKGELRLDEFWAVKDVSFELKRGECLGLIGHNGAGKTTLLRMLNGLIKPDQGRIEMRGKVGALIALGAGFNPILTGRENIYVNASVLGLNKYEIEDKLNQIIDFAEIGEFIDAPVQSYSSGMAVRLGFAIAAFINPDILMLDEVLAVGDTKFRMKCYEIIREKISSGVAAILVSHNIIDINRICNAGLVMDRGHSIYQGSVDKSILQYQTISSDYSKKGHSQGKVAFKTIKFLSDHGGEVLDIQTYDNLTVLVSLEVKEPIRNARMNFHLSSPIGHLSSISTRYAGISFDLNPPCATVSFKINKVPLLLGSYTIWLDVYGPDIQDFEAVSMPKTLYVVGPEIDTFGFGICHVLHLDHHWRIC